MLSKLSLISASKSLHSNLMNLRSLAMHGHGLQSFSTTTHAPPESKVLYEQHTPTVGEMKLNAPKNLNSLDFEMVHIMMKKLKYWQARPDTAPRVLLMSGVGGKAFCAGGDIKLIYESGTGKADPKIKTQFFHDEYVLDYNLTQMTPL